MDVRAPTEKARSKWQQFLLRSVFNLFEFTGMSAEMETNVKRVLLLGGRVAFVEMAGDLYALDVSDAGDVPVYTGQIVKYRVVNPVLGEKVFRADDGKNKVVYLSHADKCRMACGLGELIEQTADDLAENAASVRCLQFNKRIPSVFIAKTDNSMNSLQSLFDSIRRGIAAVVARASLADTVERMDAKTGTAPLSEFTEYQQYVLGTFYNMLGVNSVWNAKRERVAAAENECNDETALYNVYDMRRFIEEQLQDVNSIFGTKFHVKLSVDEMRQEQEQQEQERGEAAESDGTDKVSDTDGGS